VAQKKETAAQIKARKEAIWKKHQQKMAQQPKQGHKRLTPAEAQKIALQKFPGGRVLSTKLGYERTGRWEFTVVLKKGAYIRDVYIDSITGVIWGAPARQPGDAKPKPKGKNAWEK
jgi:uncharacterized membrane protein YkoI